MCHYNTIALQSMKLAHAALLLISRAAALRTVADSAPARGGAEHGGITWRKDRKLPLHLLWHLKQKAATAGRKAPAAKAGLRRGGGGGGGGGGGASLPWWHRAAAPWRIMPCHGMKGGMVPGSTVPASMPCSPACLSVTSPLRGG